MLLGVRVLTGDVESGVTGLVLAGGGARGAYQAGALSVVLPQLTSEGRQPRVLSGASVGALNAAGLAASAHLDAAEQAARLVDLWQGIRKKDVLPPVVPQVSRLLWRYGAELGPLPGPRLRGLIDTGPLERTIERNVDWAQLERNVGDGAPVQTLMVMATEVVSGSAVAFTAGVAPDIDSVEVVPASLDVAHLGASAAIPLLFAPVKVDEPSDAAGWYCDGSTRLTRPISPAIEAGATDVVVVSPTSLARRSLDDRRDGEPDLADVAVNVLDAVLRDVLVDDLQRCGGQAEITVVSPADPWSIAAAAEEVLSDKYRSPAGLLGSDYPLVDWALGSSSPRQAELMSYLLFDPDFIGALIDMGAEDARRVLHDDTGSA